ncbi:hypothetical protein H9L19_02550 [Weissella diestrammenae]|uniref:Tyrosine-protein phosphatase n=1 Tax=Weissella diestrammenae TaxID=1162633 RepID=A0A7G9T6N7_9LACO|nr:CpsB/CapC family capsule biosynthesis tyrosine phosphatase [Weissella diestrammenae]MCM0582953.1 hypothetical protein [Weissella diestrammenae]QNN75762.1 hypothetical protein H9L19_02550 [Weissella diestrammenae]
MQRIQKRKDVLGNGCVRGYYDLVRALSMGRKAVDDGITTLIAAPHQLNGRYKHDIEAVLAATKNLQEALLEAGIPLQICPAQEVRLVGQLIAEYDAKHILTVANGGRYLLLELPNDSIPLFTKETIFQLLQRGVTPIIVHPERHQIFSREPDKLAELIAQGAQSQITAGSYLGYFGFRTRRVTKKLLKRHLVHYMASDAHDMSLRPFSMQCAYRKLQRQNPDLAAMFQLNAADLLKTRRGMD